MNTDVNIVSIYRNEMLRLEPIEKKNSFKKIFIIVPCIFYNIQISFANKCTVY
jgi:hypothetical protein